MIIYLAHPQHTEHKPVHLYTKNRPSPVVNKMNLKVGKAHDKIGREHDYIKTFGDCEFMTLIEDNTLTPKQLQNLETFINNKLKFLRMTNPHTGRKLEWLNTNDVGMVIDIVLNAYDEYKKLAN